MRSPLVSVNTCTYNAAAYVVETLASVFAQSMQDFEVVIVDDGSTDGTPELIEREFPDPRIKIVRQHHITLRFARAIALAHSTGEFLAFLDSDDTWKPGKLARQVQIAREIGEPALVFCDADVIDEQSRQIGRFSDQFPYAEMDLRGTNGYLELLRRGNFIASPTPFIATQAIRDAGGFNLSYRHVNDFELWLRLARRHRLYYIDDTLACYRQHATQFTRKRMDVTLPEQCALLNPIIKSSAYPVAVRTALGDNMLGQHRLAARTLWQQGHYRHAVRATAGMLQYPDRLFDWVRHRLRGSVAGRVLGASQVAFLQTTDAAARARAHVLNGGRSIALRLRHAKARLDRSEKTPARNKASARPARRHIWIDGTCLHREQSGYFNLLVELIRRLSELDATMLHVTTNRRGAAALAERIHVDPTAIAFHRCGWRALHWPEIHYRLTGGLGGEAIARLIRYAWRWFPRPRARSFTPNNIEVLFWRGRYRFRDSHRVAIVQDMTTRQHPEWHTPGNVREFDEFLRYAQQHSHAIATVSERSRQDIIDRVAVPPSVVSVLPMPINPRFIRPSFDRGWLRLHRVTEPYVLTVATIEPRKNLRRLVRAFEWLRESDTLRDHKLVIVGATGWDPGFHEFLAGSDVAGRVMALGFIPTDHLPSLYHYASAVVQPSLYEGFGIPVMEAMCSSALVIASNAGALPDVLGPGGITFDPLDSRAIAAALESAMSMDTASAADYRRRGRLVAEAHLERLRTEPLLPGLAPVAERQLT
jgi:glycosyltransferase involved in cell wall biosynthesis/GT2 family glycosyltransferase